jgi:hypothetical protein
MFVSTLDVAAVARDGAHLAELGRLLGLNEAEQARAEAFRHRVLFLRSNLTRLAGELSVNDGAVGLATVAGIPLALGQLEQEAPGVMPPAAVKAVKDVLRHVHASRAWGEGAEAPRWTNRDCLLAVRLAASLLRRLAASL